MMKSYRGWKNEKAVELLMAEAVYDYIENTSPHVKSMERLGMLLGKDRNRWYELIPGLGYFMSGAATNWLGMATKGAQAREGRDTMTQINTLVQRAATDRAAAQELSKVVENMKGNSPLKLGIMEYQRLKTNMRSGNMVPDEVGLLLQVLLNCTKSSDVPFSDLKELWHRVTSISPDENDTSEEQQKRKQFVLQKELHTPVHLLNQFFKFGQNGVFTKPHNYDQIKSESGRILYAYFPERFQQLAGAADLAQNGMSKRRSTQQQNNQQNNQPTTPAPAPTPAAPPPPPPPSSPEPATDPTTTMQIPNFGYKNEKPPAPPSFAQIITAISNLSPEQKQQVLAALQNPTGTT